MVTPTPSIRQVRAAVDAMRRTKINLPEATELGALGRLGELVLEAWEGHTQTEDTPIWPVPPAEDRPIKPRQLMARRNRETG